MSFSNTFTPVNTNSLKVILHGRIILPQDPDYDDARQIYNAMIDKRPGIIIKSKDAEEDRNV